MSLVSRCVKKFHVKKSNFSIEHILNVAGEKQSLENSDLSKESKNEDKKYDWLNCTRYRPPKLPRQRKREGIQRRKSGRNPRIPFSNSQVAFLEAKFLRTPYLSSNDVDQLASYLNLSETRVKIWFQNRRARERREKETKAETRKDLIKNTPDFTSNSQTLGFIPMDFSNSLSLDYKNLFRYKTGTESSISSYHQVMVPLDLSDRQMLCSLK